MTRAADSLIPTNITFYLGYPHWVRGGNHSKNPVHLSEKCKKSRKFKKFKQNPKTSKNNTKEISKTPMIQKSRKILKFQTSKTIPTAFAFPLGLVFLTGCNCPTVLLLVTACCCHVSVSDNKKQLASKKRKF